MIANNRIRCSLRVLCLSQDGACTESFENFRDNSLKGGLSNDVTLNPPWPAVTNGGPRFDHQVCDWYRSIYATLREYDQDFFPFLDHQTLGDKTRSLLKSRRAASADVGAPSSGRPLAIHPSVAGAAWIALPYDMLTHENIRAEASSEPGMTIHPFSKQYK